jgi:ABC-type phosphate transport system auxiliary subunit
MDKYQQEATKVDIKVCNRKDLNSDVISILHCNIQSLNNTVWELAILLQSDFNNRDGLFYTTLVKGRANKVVRH